MTNPISVVEKDPSLIVPGLLNGSLMPMDAYVREGVPLDGMTPFTLRQATDRMLTVLEEHRSSDQAECCSALAYGAFQKRGELMMADWVLESTLSTRGNVHDVTRNKEVDEQEGRVFWSGRNGTRRYIMGRIAGEISIMETAGDASQMYALEGWTWSLRSKKYEAS